MTDIITCIKLLCIYTTYLQIFRNTGNLTWCTGKKNDSVLFQIICNMCIYFCHITFHIFRSAEFRYFFFCLRTHMTNIVVFIKCNAIDNPFLLQGPIRQKCKHSTGRAVFQYILIMISCCINSRRRSLTHIIILHRTNLLTHPAIPTFIFIHFRIIKSFCILFHCNSRKIAYVAACSTSTAILRTLVI